MRPVTEKVLFPTILESEYEPLQDLIDKNEHEFPKVSREVKKEIINGTKVHNN